MWEAKRIRGATRAEKSNAAVDTENVEEGLEPAKCAENTRGEEEDFEEVVFIYGFSLDKLEDADGGNKDAPEDARG